MELIMLGFNGLLILALWRFMLKKTVLDDHRDKLFDLRDELRHSFVAKGWSLDTPIYRHLRDLLNGYLRFTEHYSFGEFVALEIGFEKNKDLRKALNNHFDQKFSVTDAEQQKFVIEFRRKAVGVMMSYMILSSGPLVLVTIFLMPLVAIVALCQEALLLLHAGGKSFFSKAIEVRDVINALIRLTVGALASKLLFEQFVEEYSYRQA